MYKKFLVASILFIAVISSAAGGSYASTGQRIMLLVDELVGENAPFMPVAESEILRVFEKAGCLLVDTSQASALVNLDPSSSGDQAKIIDAARTLKADIVVMGKAYAGAFTEQKVHGVKLFGVKGSVRLDAVATKTAYRIGSVSAERTTGKKPALSLGEGAERCIRGAASDAAGQILAKIEQARTDEAASAGAAVNIRISGVSFRNVESIEDRLRDFVGEGGEVMERAYADSSLELDVISIKSAREIADMLSVGGINVDSMTQQTIRASVSAYRPQSVPLAVVTVRLTDVKLFEEGTVIEEVLRGIVGDDGSTVGDFDGNAAAMTITLAFRGDIKTAREVAAFLDRPDAKSLEPEFSGLAKHRIFGIKVTGVSSDTVSGGLLRGLW